MKKTSLFISLFVVLALLSACSGSEEVILLTEGSQEYTKSELEALGTISVDYTDKDGETTTYEGVLLSSLLEDAGVTGDNITFTAADDYTAEATMEEVMGCSNCIVAFDGDSLRTVMPDFSGKLQVKDLVVISVQ